MRKYYIFIGVLSCLVIALVGVTFHVVGSPLAQQQKAQDQAAESDFTPTPTPSPLPNPLEAGDQILNASCAGELKNGMCVLSGCMYTYPINIYSKGKAVDVDGNSFVNECNQTGEQIYVNFCSKRSEQSSDYVHDAHIFDCPKGCKNGVCLQ